VIFLFIGILFFFTQLTKVNLGHLLAIAFTISLVLIYIQSNLDTNQGLLTKLDNLGTSNYSPKYMYMDASLIILFESIKKDFYKYNKKTYNSALKACDNLLQIKYDMQLKLLPQPQVENILINFPEYEMKKNVPKTTNLVNAYQNYEAADIQYKLCINYLHSYIINIPSNPALHKKYSIILEKGDILLKRNMDTIYNIYMKNKSKSDRDITDYDLQVPSNKFSDNNLLTKSFDYI
jgi:hypothetical protein